MKSDESRKPPVGQVCTIDNLGRIVIPALMRKAYKMEKNDDVELIMDNDAIIMRKYQPGCIFCGKIHGLEMFKGQLICKECLEEMKK